MRTIKGDIEIATPPGFCLEVSNDLARWPELMPEYKSAIVIRHEGKKVWFELQHDSGSRWISWRRIDKENLLAYAERSAPLEPFKYMHILWLYRPTQAGCQMIWEMTFEPVDLSTEETWRNRFDDHTRLNMARMKSIIEDDWAASGTIHHNKE